MRSDATMRARERITLRRRARAGGVGGSGLGVVARARATGRTRAPNPSGGRWQHIARRGIKKLAWRTRKDAGSGCGWAFFCSSFLL
jgi:hypothetical protein